MSAISPIPVIPLSLLLLAEQKTRYHKPHMFDLQNGIRVDMNKDGVPAVAAAAIANGTYNVDALSVTTPSSTYAATFGAESKTNKGNDAEVDPTSLPSWVAFDRKVLRFYCYFKEAVFSSPVENYRVRKCVLYFYLEDDSIHIAEPKIENSGIQQGVLVKRARITKPNSNEVFAFTDLNIGEELLIFGRIYRLTDCDAFTRAFMESNGIALGEPEEIPLDPFTKKNTVRATAHNKMMHPHKQFLEASLGKSMYGTDIEGTQKFLRNDGKVLRFYATWSDPKLLGEKQAYILHYFLADDTVEVLEVQQPNSGRDPFPALLKRGKLPKNYKDHTADLSRIGYQGEKGLRYYTEADFKIGQYVNVYGRKLFLCGADQFTQEFYIANFGMTAADFPRLNMDEEVEVVPRLPPPPHTGFGSEEDSLGSFFYLMTKVPKQDFKKLMENDGLTMRFMAKFVNPQPEDKDRRFIITFYLNNDTISVFEKFERNSGFIGGKFLERSRVKNEATADYFKPTDLYAGARVSINKFLFDLIGTDEHTLNWMNQNGHIFGDILAKQQAYLDANPQK